MHPKVMCSFDFKASLARMCITKRDMNAMMTLASNTVSVSGPCVWRTVSSGPVTPREPAARGVHGVTDQPDNVHPRSCPYLHAPPASAFLHPDLQSHQYRYLLLHRRRCRRLHQSPVASNMYGWSAPPSSSFPRRASGMPLAMPESGLLAMVCGRRCGAQALGARR